MYALAYQDTSVLQSSDGETSTVYGFFLSSSLSISDKTSNAYNQQKNTTLVPRRKKAGYVIHSGKSIQSSLSHQKQRGIYCCRRAVTGCINRKLEDPLQIISKINTAVSLINNQYPNSFQKNPTGGGSSPNLVPSDHFPFRSNHSLQSRASGTNCLKS